jgi:transposase
LGWKIFRKNLSLKAKERIGMQNKQGRPPVIPQKLYEYDFAAAAKKEKVAFCRVKLLALEQIKLGHGYRETAKTFGVHETAIKNWVLRVAEEGLSGLKLKPGRGRKKRLQQNQVEAFKKAVIELQNKRSGGRINVADITKMANEKFKLSYKVKGMYWLLHSINMVWISARSKHPSHNAIAQEAFKKTL